MHKLNRRITYIIKKGLNMERKGYFFTLDAFLAMVILLIGVAALLGYSVYTPQPQQPERLGKNVLSVFGSSKVKDINDPYYGAFGNLVKSGKINDTEKTLIQVLGQFYYYGDLNNSAYLISNFTEGYISGQYHYEFLIDNLRVYPVDASAQHNLSRNKTSILMPAKAISFGRINSSFELFGPYEVKLLIWQ